MPNIEETSVDYEILHDSTGKEYTHHSILQGIVLFASLGTGGGPWLNCVSTMGTWYGSNVDSYQGGPDSNHAIRKTAYYCPLVNGNVYDDCSGFVQACLLYYGLTWPGLLTTSVMNSDKFIQFMSTNGFTHFTGTFNPSNSQAGDILCGGPQTHTTIYGGNNQIWDWGNNRFMGKNGGMPRPWFNYHYINCWRKI